MLDDTQVGPLARLDILDKIQLQVDESIALGANLVCGGKKLVIWVISILQQF